jgi:hypothetical protein
MWKFALLAFVALTQAVVAAARVGETEPELVRRYGKVGARSKEQVMEQQRFYVLGEVLQFRSGGWYIQALMIKGHCERISYYKSGDWTEAQFKHLLEINGGLDSWRDADSRDRNMIRNWRRSDGTTAFWQNGMSFCVTTPVVDQTRAAIKAAAKAEASKLPPF